MSPSLEERIADYCTGQMSLDEAERFEAEMSRDHRLAEIVAGSLERMSALDDTATPLEPHPDLWRRIDAGLGASARTVSSPRGSRKTVWSSLSFWRSAAIAGLTTSAALTVALVALVMQPLPSPAFVAILVPGNSGVAGAVVEVDAGGNARLITLQSIPVPSGRALQVWTLPSRERGPVSIGLLDAAHSAVLDLRSLPPTRTDQLFEITLEPASGSPIGRPTGPILFKGLAVQTL